MIKTLWQFSRPHTIIGSTLSILSLYFFAIEPADVDKGIYQLLLPTLISALLCNIYIVGLNQWSDVELDIINKPNLPIPAGKLSRSNAFRIVVIAGCLSALLAWLQGASFFLLIIIIGMIGTAYSLPPLKFKKHHFGAAVSITLVRGFLVNLGFYLHFKETMYGPSEPVAALWALISFVALFSIGIAWFKDIPDSEGDHLFKIATLTLILGKKKTTYLGVITVSLGYFIMIVSAIAGVFPLKAYYIVFHLALWLIFLILFWTLDLSNKTSIKRFYLMFWGLFFLEYILFPLGYQIRP